MAKTRPPTYTPAPQPPTDPDLRRRYDAIMSVLAQTQTVSAAAESIGMSRNHFQTILHRVITAIIDALTPKPAGRPAKPARETALEAENERLNAELTSLKARSTMIERLMGVVSEISSGRTRLPKSRVRSNSKKKTTDESEPAPSPSTSPIHHMVTTMSDVQVPTSVWAKLLGISESTVRRRLKPALERRRTRTQPTHDELAGQRVRSIVRATHGQVGAASLSKTCGLPRRRAAAIKKRELREMELERKRSCRTVSVLAPGLVRGFDAMHVPCIDGKAYWLVAADAAVPFRTSIVTAPAYDAAHVIEALTADFDEHGPPLVLRLDRIACHRTPEVEQLLRRYQVLALHGPPRHPYFYGQLERQNREHRAWQEVLEPVTRAELAAAAGSMRTALNALWARPTLGWCTAQHAWEHRPAFDIDREKLCFDVEFQAAGLVSAGVEVTHARRLAIETALTARGLLIIKQGGRC
jgi:transposase InsO family protein